MNRTDWWCRCKRMLINEELRMKNEDFFVDVHEILRFALNDIFV